MSEYVSERRGIVWTWTWTSSFSSSSPAMEGGDLVRTLAEDVGDEGKGQ